jgi:hypothetical protein
MGDYNPHHPTTLGMQWVPIRGEPYPLNPDEEIGVSFTVGAEATVATAGFFVDQPPAGISSQHPMITVYRLGQETATGPIRTLDVPVSGGVLGGGAVGGEDVAAALASPADGAWVLLPTTAATVDLSFAIDAPAAADLAGKRILNLELRYVAKKAIVDLPSVGSSFSAALFGPGGSAWAYGTMAVSATSMETTEIDSLPFGDINPDSAAYSTDPADRLPWTYPQLRRLAAGAANPLTVHISGDLEILLHHAALRITYCDESRVAVGAKTSWFGSASYRSGVNTVGLWDPLTLTRGVSLTPGQYTATITLAMQGPTTLVGPKPTLRRLRQLTPLPTHRGVIVTRATSSTPPAVPIATATASLVPLVVSTDTGVVAGCHGYDTQLAAPVFGSTTVTQILPAGDASLDYQLVRVYARRRGATTTALTIRNVANPTQAAAISPSHFDTLPEIIDGWREVTLPLPAPVALAVSTSWEIIAPGEVSANRWEILGARTTAPELGPATHGGTTIRLTWDDPAVAGGASPDTSADAALTVLASPAPVTGLTVTEHTQVLPPADPACPSGTAGIATGIGYHRLTWTPPQTIAATDPFDRPVTGGWGTTPAGLAWTTSGGAAADYTVAAGMGAQTLTSAAVARRGLLALALAHLEVHTTLQTPALATTARVEAGVVVRWQNANNHVAVMVDLNPDQSVGLRITQVIEGRSAVIGLLPAVAGLTHLADTGVRLRVAAVGGWIHAAAWPTTAAEPTGWHLSAPTIWTRAAQTGLGAMRAAANTNTNLTVAFDDITVTHLLPGFGTLELRRSDALDPTWHTILSATTATVAGFSDFEARVAVASTYRIRLVDQSGATSAWSPGVTHTLTTPGVRGARTGQGLLMFTTNQHQADGAALAYTTVFDRTPSRESTFPEAETVTVQRMFGRDFQTVFHGTERGGERFTRTLLIQTAAGGATSTRLRQLRDLAWADLPYVCVRDETGQRWLAAITVPSATLLGRRGTLLAQVEITEVTDTPHPIDPAVTS